MYVKRKSKEKWIFSIYSPKHKNWTNIFNHKLSKDLIEAKKSCENDRFPFTKWFPVLNFDLSKDQIEQVMQLAESFDVGEKLYLSSILDLFNGEIIAYNVEKRPVYPPVSKM